MLQIYYFFISLFTARRTQKAITTAINNAVNQTGGEIIDFIYDRKHFGNIILVVKKDDKEYKYVVDRSEIYFNNQMVCNDSYCREENKEPYQKLIEIIISTII